MLLCDWATPCSLAGIHLIDPRLPTLEFIAAIRASRLVLAESMHGAMVADAFGVPWIPVVSSGEILSFKWQDWLDTLELEYRPYRILQRIPWGWARIRGGLRRMADDSGLSRQRARTPHPSLFHSQPGNEACAEGLLSASRQPPALSGEGVRNRIAERLLETILAFARFARDPAAHRQCSAT